MKKRVLAAALALLLLPWSGTAARAASEKTTVSGPRFSAAEAARLARRVDRGNEAHPYYDITGNGAVDETDVRAALWEADGLIPDLTAFCAALKRGICSEKLFDRFSYAGTFRDDNGNYRSENVGVRVTSATYLNSVYYLADICVRDITSIAAGFAGGKDGGGTAPVIEQAAAYDAIIAINGDFYAARQSGPVVRNGVVLHDWLTQIELGVLSRDGVLHTFRRYALTTCEEVAALDPWQVWTFGPALLDENGDAFTGFESRVSRENPRSVFGYYEPGHYCFLLVDGRNYGYSTGLTLDQLAKLCSTLGMKQAYNLDGGQSAILVTPERVLSKPYTECRPMSDIVYVKEPDGR